MNYFFPLFNYIRNNLFQIIRFFIVGIIIFLVNISLIYLLTKYFDDKLSASISYFICIFLHFLLHKYFTYGFAKNDKKIETKISKNIAKYLIMLIINYLIYISFFTLFSEYFNINIYLSIFMINCFSPIITFLLLKYYVFYNNKL